MEDERPRISVLLADPHALFREAMRVALARDPELAIVAEAESGRDAVAEAERVLPKVAILDLNLPVYDGVRATQMIKERVPSCGVLVLSAREDYRALMEVLEAGATGYLTKDSPLSQLIDATRSVHAGQTVIPPRMLGSLLSQLIRRRREQDDALQRIARLTRREREVLRLLAEGAGNEAVGRALVISPQTARTHIQNIMQKLGVHTRLEAAMFVTQHGLLDELELPPTARTLDAVPG